MALYQNRLEELLDKFSRNTVSETEFNELCELIEFSENEAAIKAKLASDLQQASYTELEKSKLDKMLRKVLQPEEAPVYMMHKRKAFNWVRVAAAAVIILLLSVGGYFYFTRTTNHPTQEIAQEKVKQDVAPGKPGAILTLANGKQIVLDSAGNGKISDAAIKNGNEVSYINSETNVVESNTMSTPKGRQFELVLADGSKVWLNAASSITYPTAFTGNERKVSITGEVYFEVIHNAAKPFRVTVNGINVEDLGTHFNINAYDDEAVVKTTLLEGSVKILRYAPRNERDRQDDKGVVLKPGQQAIIGQPFDKLRVTNTDVDEVMGWKNGLFHFESADLKTILRQFARWYDVEIVYEGNVSDKKYFCIVNKNTSLQNVLKTLQAGNIKFRIEGKKLFVQQ